MKHTQHIRGMTLLELLVALVVFSFVLTLAYGTFDNALLARTNTHNRGTTLDALQFAVNKLMQDTLQIAIHRTVRADENSTPVPAFSITKDVLTFVRFGYHNTTGVDRSTLEYVRYFLDDENALVRESRVPINAVDNKQTRRIVLLHDSTAVQFRILRADGTATTQWPEEAENTPHMLEIHIDTHTLGSVTRLIPLPYAGEL